jgi:hypothetical protein
LTTPADLVTPRCYDCLSGDVTVKVIDEMGFEHWFCAEDWAAEREFGERLRKLLAGAAERLAGP